MPCHANNLPMPITSNQRSFEGFPIRLSHSVLAFDFLPNKVMVADSLATTNSGKNLCSHLDGLCLFLQPPPHMDSASFIFSIFRMLPGMALRPMSRDPLRPYLYFMLLESLSFFCFWKFWPLTFPSVPFVFCMSEMRHWCSVSLCSHQKPQLRSQQFTLPLKGTSSLPYWELKNCLLTSAFILFAFILLFWPRHLSF